MGDAIAKTTVLGAVGGASLATTMALGSATAGAKAGSIVGTLAGPVGVAVGAAVGGAAGFASYWVAKGISALVNDDNSGDTATEKGRDEEESDGEDRKRRRGEEKDEESDRDDQEENDRNDEEESDREDESSASEDEIVEESTESSDYETFLQEILQRIEFLPMDAPISVRVSLFLELCDSLNPVFFDIQNRVRIDRAGRHLAISVPGFRNIHLGTRLRDALSLFNIDNIEEHLDPVDEREQALIYLLRCRLCNRNYVGLSTNFPNRQSTHKSNVKKGNKSSPNQHLQGHRNESDTQLTFDNSFDVIFLRGLPAEVNLRMTNKKIKKILRNWEVFLQWLFKGRVGDGGIGKR